MIQRGVRGDTPTGHHTAAPCQSSEVRCQHPASSTIPHSPFPAPGPPLRLCAPASLRLCVSCLAPTLKLNQKLHAWWTLDFPAFRTEAAKALKTDIPLKERGDWEDALASWQAEHHQLPRKLIAIEQEINAPIYCLYDLSPADIQLLDEHAQHAMTNCAYGEA